MRYREICVMSSLVLLLSFLTAPVLALDEPTAIGTILSSPIVYTGNWVWLEGVVKGIQTIRPINARGEVVEHSFVKCLLEHVDSGLAYTTIYQIIELADETGRLLIVVPIDPSLSIKSVGDRIKVKVEITLYPQIPGINTGFLECIEQMLDKPIGGVAWEIRLY